VSPGTLSIMSDPNTPAVPAAWYPDTEVPGGQRWWDGSAWTEHRTPPAAPAAPAVPQYAQNPYAPQQQVHPQYGQPQQYAQQGYAQPQQYGANPYAQPQHYTQFVMPEHAWPYVGQPAPVGVEVPLWAPLYNASMMQAWQRFWRKYVDFSGRASRSEYWYSALWMALLVFASYFIFVILGVVLGSAFGGNSGSSVAVGVLGLLWFVAYVGVLIPMIAVQVRRLHDAGYSGAYFFMGFIPFVGSIFILIYTLSESKPQGAIYDLPR
jgi:uncharacterized membrane protein YhaH (DUF805 family)